MSNVAELRFAKPSLIMRLGEWVISKRDAGLGDAAELERSVPTRKLPQDAPMPRSFERRFDIERWERHDQQVISLQPKGSRGAKHIIYFHGGGFILPMFKEHWPLIAALIDATGASISVPLYKVAPEATHEPATDLAHAVFDQVAQDWSPRDIVLAGDSAGGNMALVTALQRRDQGLSMPGKLVLFAPWLDLTMSDPSARDVEPRDVMLKVDALRVMGNWWIGDRDPKGPYCSPLNADVKGLPPIAIFQGRNDVFVVDSHTFAENARTSGHSASLFEYAGAPHVFMALTFTREAKDCFALVRKFLAEGG